MLGGVSRNAVERGETISNSDLAAMEAISNKAGVDADVFLACEAKTSWGKKPGIRAVRAERDRLRAQILAMEPEIIVCFGSVAVKAVFNKALKVGELRHRRHTLEEWPCPVWVSYSLEEVAMKQGLLKFMGIDLLRGCKGELDVKLRPYRVLMPHTPEWYVMPAELDFSEGWCSMDLETYPGTDPHHPDARIRMMSISTDGKTGTVVQADECSEFPEWVRAFLRDPSNVKTGSNIRFDVRWLRRFGYDVDNYVCTSHMQHLIDENSSHNNLKALTLLYTDVGDYAREHNELVRERKGWEFIADDEQYAYAAADGYCGYEISMKQLDIIRKDGLIRPYSMMVANYQSITDLQLAGANLDMKENARLKAAYDERIAGLTSEIHQELGPFNINSPKQLVAKLQHMVPDINLKEFFRKNIDQEDKYSTKAAILRREGHKHPVIGKILDYRRRHTLRNFVTGIHKHIVDVNGRSFVFSEFRGDVTVTGRLSSQRPNLQNLPRNTDEEEAEHLNVKRQYVSRFPGGSILEADQSQLELRVAAMVSADHAMLEAFEAGIDVHTALAAKMRSITPEQVTKKIRQDGKTTNFHVLYGGRAWGLSFRLGCTKVEADGLIRDFQETFTGFVGWQHEKELEAMQNQIVLSMFGWPRRFPVRPPNWKSPEGRRILRQAVNAPIQVDASLITNIGIGQAARRIKREGLRSVPFITVHDSLVVDVFPGEEDRIICAVREEMENPNTRMYDVELSMPLKVDVKIGPSWGEVQEC